MPPVLTQRTALENLRLIEDIRLFVKDGKKAYYPIVHPIGEFLI